jgi:hypothetical protein
MTVAFFWGWVNMNGTWTTFNEWLYSPEPQEEDIPKGETEEQRNFVTDERVEPGNTGLKNAGGNKAAGSGTAEILGSTVWNFRSSIRARWEEIGSGGC